MAVKPGQYGQHYEKAIAAGKSASEAHDIAGKAASVKAKPEGKKKSWVQKLKTKVGVQLKSEKERRMKLKAKTIAGEGRLKKAGKKTTKELEQKYKTVKVKKVKKAEKKTTRTKHVESGLKTAGLTEAEIKRLKRKK